MAYYHQHNHQPSTYSCSHRCYSPAPPPVPDPLLLQSIFSLLLHNYPTPSPAAFSGSACSLLDHHSFCSEHSQHQNQKSLNQKESPLPHQPSEHLSQTKCAVLSSLLQRIDLLESSFHRFSSATSSDSTLTLRDLAARRIQARFRAFLVRRSRGFRRLKELVSVKSTLDALKSSILPHKRLDSVSVSREAICLIDRLETIQGGDKVTRDSKSSVLRDFDEFVELVEGICVRRNEVSSETIKNIRPVRSDDKSRVSCAGRESEGVCHGGNASKHCNLDKDEKRLIDNLKERLERIQEISEVVESEDECIGVEKLNRLLSNVEKQVRFLEDENATRVCNGSRLSVSAKKIDTVEKQQDDEEVESDGDENPAGSIEGNEDDEAENEVCEDEVETENEGCGGDEDEAENEVCEGEDETENEGSGDDYETENEVCEDEYETENEGSEVEDETENEVCEDEYETENEGSGDEDETGSEDYEDEDETGSEDYEDEDETENGSHNEIPQGNKNNGYVEVTTLANPLNSVQFVRQSFMQRREESAKIVCNAEMEANGQVINQKNIEETRDDKGSDNHRRYLRNVICHNCNKRGHMKRDCWFNPTRRCRKCSAIGHTKEVCGVWIN